MSVSRAKRTANNKWDAENMKLVACKVKKEDAEAFKAYADGKGSTPNALLREFIFECIGKHETTDEEGK